MYMQSITGYDKLNILKFSQAYDKQTETISLVHVDLYVSEIHLSLVTLYSVVLLLWFHR